MYVRYTLQFELLKYDLLKATTNIDQAGSQSWDP